MLPRYKDIIDLLKKGSTLEAQEQIMNLREGALELQEENQELKNRIRDLEKKLIEIDEWNKEKERYVLKSPWPGSPVSVYHLKQSHSNGEEPHWLCPNCFQVKRKSILNTNQKRGEFVHLVCSVCKASIDTTYRGIGGPEYAEKVKK